MSNQVPSGVESAESARNRDIERVFRAVINAHPRDILQLLCGVTLRDGDVITTEPAPWSVDACPHHPDGGSPAEQHNIPERIGAARDIGREVGRFELMRAALKAAHGEIPDLDELAMRLAGRDPGGNMARIVTGVALEDLRT